MSEAVHSCSLCNGRLSFCTSRSSVFQDSLMQRRVESERDACHLVEMMSISEYLYSLGQPANSATRVRSFTCLSITLEELPVMDVGWCRELTWNQKFLSSKDWSVLRFVQSDANPIQKLMKTCMCAYSYWTLHGFWGFHVRQAVFQGHRCYNHL